jgi:hypothetical protein
MILIILLTQSPSKKFSFVASQLTTRAHYNLTIYSHYTAYAVAVHDLLHNYMLHSLSFQLDTACAVAADAVLANASR